MSYGLLYTLPFRNNKQKLYTVKVEQEGYTGEAIELKGQSSPFTVTIDDESFLYTPMRCSTATLHLFGSDYLQSLFSTDYRMNRVTLYDGDNPVWCGYVKPEIYTQDFRHVKFPLDIECYSAMSVLEFIDFKQQGETRSFVSLWDLIKLCIKESGGLYSAVYVPHTYAKDAVRFTNWENPLSGMTVSQQNFFDEDDKAMTLKEVLENIMQLLGWTCVDWQGELYFVDVDNESGEYYKYTPDLASYERVSAESVQVQDIGFSGADHTLDIMPGYNKVTVRCSNYPVGDALPDYSFDAMAYVTEFTRDGGNNTKVYYRIKRAISFETGTYMRDEAGVFTPLSLEDERELDFSEGFPVGFVGCIPMMSDRYDVDDDGNPLVVDYELSEYFNIPAESRREPIYSKDNQITMIKVKGASSAYSDGAFAINFNVTFGAFVDKSTLTSYDFHFQLRVGDQYYHGKADGTYKWDSNPDTDTEYDNNLLLEWTEETTDLNIIDKAFNLKTTRKLGDGLNGVKGYICKLPSKILSGEVELTIWGPCVIWNNTLSYSLELRDFDFQFAKIGDGNEELDSGESDSDRLYENVINENYINALDDIELKISSYNKDGACYSKVLLDGGYLTNFYNGITNEFIRPEEFLIRRIINHYSATKYKLTLDIKNKEVKPFTVLSDSNTPGKTYINIGGEIDYQQNKFSCIMLER